MSEDGLRAIVMDAVVKEELRVAPRLLDRPSGKCLRDIDDVFLRVSAVHAERVQLHKFAAIVLIQAALLFLVPCRVRRRRAPCLRETRHSKPSAAETSAHSHLAL